MSQVTGSRRGSAGPGLELWGQAQSRLHSSRPSCPALPQRAEGAGWGSPQLQGPVSAALSPAPPPPGTACCRKQGRETSGSPRPAHPLHPAGTHRRTYGEARRLGRGLLRARCLPEAECQAVRGPPARRARQARGCFRKAQGAVPGHWLRLQWLLAARCRGPRTPRGGEGGGGQPSSLLRPGSPRHRARPTQSQQARGSRASPLPQGPAAAHAHCGLPGRFLPRGPRIEGGRTP